MATLCNAWHIKHNVFMMKTIPMMCEVDWLTDWTRLGSGKKCLQRINHTHAHTLTHTLMVSSVWSRLPPCLIFSGLDSEKNLVLAIYKRPRSLSAHKQDATLPRMFPESRHPCILCVCVWVSASEKYVLRGSEDGPVLDKALNWLFIWLDC